MPKFYKQRQFLLIRVKSLQFVYEVEKLHQHLYMLSSMKPHCHSCEDYSLRFIDDLIHCFHKALSHDSALPGSLPRIHPCSTVVWSLDYKIKHSAPCLFCTSNYLSMKYWLFYQLNGKSSQCKTSSILNETITWLVTDFPANPCSPTKTMI